MILRELPICLLAATAGMLAGCRAHNQVRDPHCPYVADSSQPCCHAGPSLEQAVNPVASSLEGPHPVERYIEIALTQNPEIQAARNRVDALAYQMPVAASLQDPMLNLTVQPEPVQTAAGQQEVILSASQKVPWPGKLDTRFRVAEAKTNRARAQLAAVELATVAKVKRAYYELYFVQQTVQVTEEEQRLLVEIREVATTRYRTGQTSQQDVLRADLEISNVENELIRLRQQIRSGQARLAGLLNVSPQTQLRALDVIPDVTAVGDLDLLLQQAVAARPELHAQLAAIERDRHAVTLARLEYKPDVTVGFSWIDVANAGISPVTNGRDALLLTAGVNLPVYRNRLEASVRSAEAQAVSSLREYDAVRNDTLQEVADLFAQAVSQQDLLILFRDDILPKARQTLEVSSRAYNVGEVDFLQLIDNWRQLLRYEVGYRRLEASLRQTAADLERSVGGLTGPPAVNESVPLPPT